MKFFVGNKLTHNSVNIEIELGLLAQYVSENQIHLK